MPACYILYSKKLDKFYIGATSHTVEDPFAKHITGYYDKKFTSKADDWDLFLEIECTHVKQAFGIEAHIKRMKSRKYIENLKRYSALIEKLLFQYS